MVKLPVVQSGPSASGCATGDCGSERGPCGGATPEERRLGAERRFWRSLEEHAVAAGDGAGAGGRGPEFPEGATEPPDPVSRRGFLQLLGASVALAGLEGCRPPPEPILPYVRQPEGVTPGRPLHFATALSLGGRATGLVVRTYEGRPTKVEGNPQHPASLGASGPFEQAAILELYDPRRLRAARRRGTHLGRRALLTELSNLARAHEKDGGARLRFLGEPTSSTLLAELRARLQRRFPQARFVTHAAVTEDAAREGARLAFGRVLDPVLHPGKAQVVLALDADFLAEGPDHLRHLREFSATRVAAEMSRLYVAEAGHSTTGAAADHHLRMRSAEVLPFARAVAGELARAHGLADLAALAPDRPPEGEVARRARAVAADLARARGRSLLVAGHRQPPALHALAHALNGALGNAGAAVTLVPSALPDDPAGPRALQELAGEIRDGRVDALVVTAWNPVYSAPADLELAALLPKVPNAIYLALRDDETSARAAWVLAAAHPFETWGDTRALDGTVSLVQPLLAPLYESYSEVDLFAALLDQADQGAHKLLRDLWKARRPALDFDRQWETWLAEGVVPNTASPPQTAPPRFAEIAAAVRAVPPPAAEGLEVNFVPDPKVWDGRYASNAWLQELPHPLTKITWDNAAFVSPATARRLGLESGDGVSLTIGGRRLDAAAYVMPGQADEVVVLPLGYGRSAGGPVAEAKGFRAEALRTAGAPWFAPGLELAKTGRRHDFAVTQGHFSIEGRPIAFSFTRDHLDHELPELEHRRGSPATLQEPVDYTKQTYRWGMAVDMSRCIGCSGCVVACQAENNVPVVGKRQVMKSREMHWLRIDRYFSGSPEDPEVLSEPMLCQHCETAPCEYVCPVNATVHSDEGLNEMIYNRCVGTRYCSNNCPYKVRRFNFLDYRRGMSAVEKMPMNPDVTVRARGVMEKCTFCVQRIEAARIDSRVQGRTLRDGELQTACAQACAAEAIVFGNLNDPEAKVSRLQRDARRFDVLFELGTRPRVGYLAQVKNPNPELT